MKVEIGRVFSGMFAMVRDQFMPLAGLWGVFLLFQVLLIGLIFGGIGGTALLTGNLNPEDALDVLGLGAGILLVMLVAYFVYLYLYGVQSAAMVQSASPRMRSGFGEALSGGFRCGFSMLGVFLLLFVGYIILSFIVGLLELIFGFLGSFGDFLVSLIAFAALVYLACRLSVIVPVVAVDGERNPISAIRRTWDITNGNLLPIFLIALIVVALVIVMAIVFGVVFGGVFFATAASGAPAFGTFFAMILTFAVFGGAFSIFGSALVAALHAEISSSETEELGRTFE